MYQKISSEQDDSKWEKYEIGATRSKNRGVEFRDFAHPLQASGVVPFYASQKNTVPLRNDSFLCRMRRVRSGCNLKKHKHHHSKRPSSHPRKVGDFHRHDSS